APAGTPCACGAPARARAGSLRRRQSRHPCYLRAPSSLRTCQARGDLDPRARALEQLRERAALVRLRDGGLERVVVEPVDRDGRLDVRGDDLVALALDLVHDDRHADVEPAWRRAGLGQLA